MILTRTPFRITLGGGGTDLPGYSSEHGGYCLTATINKFMYVSVNQPSLERWVRVHYTRWEEVGHVGELVHDLAREALRWCGIANGIEVSSMADLPAGTGLGSSAAYLVGLLAALHQMIDGTIPNAERLASEACMIELGVLKRPVGKQDQYAVACGGLRSIAIDTAAEVHTVPFDLPGSTAEVFERRVRLYYTGVQRDTATALDPIVRHLAEKQPEVTQSLHRIKQTAFAAEWHLRDGDLDGWAQTQDVQWHEKRLIAPWVSTPNLDALYKHVRDAHGVLGGRIIGAGAGGFLMLVAPEGGEADELDRCVGMPRLDYRLEPCGVKVLAA